MAYRPASAYLRIMTGFLPPSELTTLFNAHGLTATPHRDWWLVDDLYPALRLTASDGMVSAEIALDEERTVSELYPPATGLTLFRDGVFPLLMSVFWQKHDPNTVTHQVIRRADGPWQVFVGRYLREVATGERPPVPYGLFGALEAFLKDAALDRDLHWLSTGVAVDEDGPIVRVRLDGVRQTALEDQLRALDWIYDGRDYSLRNVMLAVRS